MLLSQRPLTGSEVDAPLLSDVHDGAVASVLSGVVRGRNTLVLGDQGSGRTTLLQVVAGRLRTEFDGPVAYLDAAAWSSTRELVAAIAATLGHETRSEETRTYRHLDSYLEEQEREANDIYEIVRPRPLNERDVDVVLTAASGRPSVLILDNLGGTAAHDLFGRFRDTIWRAPIVWVAAASVDDNEVLAPPADVFWERVVILERLLPEEARQMIAARLAAADVEDPDRLALAEQIDDLAAGLDRPTPRDVVAAMVSALEPEGGRLVPGDPLRRKRAKDAGGRRSADLLYELELLGRPAHAGDRRLLDRLRISRARASQLLNALDEAGLVRSFDAGRRKMYEPVPLP